MEAKAYGTRAEHLEWAKQRALEYLPDAPTEAMTSFISDLGKHQDLMLHPARDLMFSLAMIGKMGTPQEVREFIEGTN